MKVEYIPGDLVKHDGHVVEIAEVYTGNWVFLRGKDFDRPSVYSLERVTPIPLTSEILLKNGCKLKDGAYFYVDAPIKILEQYQGYMVYLYDEDTSLRLHHIKTVSDLQHILFGLGLDSSLEV